jgi:hypothetical protein
MKSLDRRRVRLSTGMDFYKKELHTWMACLQFNNVQSPLDLRSHINSRLISTAPPGTIRTTLLSMQEDFWDP